MAGFLFIYFFLFSSSILCGDLERIAMMQSESFACLWQACKLLGNVHECLDDDKLFKGSSLEVVYKNESNDPLLKKIMDFTYG